jgi:hypothetical protein
MAHLSGSELREKNVAVMGPNLGTLYSDLQNEILLRGRGRIARRVHGGLTRSASLVFGVGLRDMGLAFALPDFTRS